MLTLILVLCLNASCREERIPGPTDASLMGCLMSAQQSAARFLEDHPQMAAWRLRSIRCEAGRQIQT